MRHYVLTPDRISTRQHCYDRYEPLTKHPANPVFQAERSWEGAHVGWPTILYLPTEAVHKMWYQAIVEERAATGGSAAATVQSYVCYAESENGLDWSRPALDLVAAERYPGNNIVEGAQGPHLDSPSVLYDETDPDPRRRYKMAYYDQDGRDQGVRTKVSADGIRWQEAGEFPVMPAQDALKLFHDRRRGRYYLNLKDRILNRRSRLMSVSDDFEHWGEPTECISPNLGDDESTHFYDMLAFPHGDVTVGFLTIFDAATQVCHTELVNGGAEMNFKRLPSRPTVLAPGNAGDWDGGGVYTSSGAPIVGEDGRRRYYYYGARLRHDIIADAGEPASGFGVAEYDEGRLCGQQFVGEGYFVTVALLCTGTSLRVDADAKESLKVSIACCGYPQSHDGYDFDDCEELHGDSKSHAVRWRDKRDVAEFKGRYIKVMIAGRNAVVYGLKIE